MPNVDDLKARQQARELRKANREANVERAFAQDANLSTLQQANQQKTDEATARTDEAAQRAAAAGRPAPTPPPKKKVTRTEVTNVQKAAHARQAEKDAQLVPAEIDVQREFDRWDGVGQSPLHVLNAIAEQTDRAVRDEGKEIAAGAAKGAYEIYTGKIAGKRSRHNRMRAQIAAGEQQIALRKKTETE